MHKAPLFITLQVALAATLLALGAGLVVAAALRRRRSLVADLLDVLCATPMILPPTVLGYYLLVTIGRESPIGALWESVTGSPLVFTRTGAIIAAAIAGFPFVVRASRTAFEEVPEDLIVAAATLRAGPWRRFFTIELPLAWRGIAVGVMLAFARGLGEFGITLMVAGNIPGRTQTAALAIYDAVQSQRDHEALALSIVLTLSGIAILLLVKRMTPLRKSRPWEL